MKIDPYKNKESYYNWLEKNKDRIPGISKENSDILLRFIFDMQNGLNVSKGSKKGPRGYTRLNNLKQRLVVLSKKIEERLKKNLTELDAEEAVIFFNQIRDGTIKRMDGKPYGSIRDFTNPFKSFWHWYMRIYNTPLKLGA